MRAAAFVALFGSCIATSCMLESPTEPSIADCQPLCDASALRLLNVLVGVSAVVVS